MNQSSRGKGSHSRLHSSFVPFAIFVLTLFGLFFYDHNDYLNQFSEEASWLSHQFHRVEETVKEDLSITTKAVSSISRAASTTPDGGGGGGQVQSEVPVKSEEENEKPGADQKASTKSTDTLPPENSAERHDSTDDKGISVEIENSEVPDFPYNASEISWILSNLTYRIEDESIHEFFATNSTLTRTHSGSSHKARAEKKLSPAQSTLVPLDGAPPQKYQSCALVGNARSLLKRTYGLEIDKHDAVLRLNQAPTKSFEKYVGSKTTHRLINHKWASAYSSDSKLQLDRDVTLVVSRTDWKSFLRIAQKFRSKRPDISLLLLSRDGVNKAGNLLRAMKAKMESIRGETYPGKASPSSGFVGTYLLFQMCANIDIYGVGTEVFKESVPNWHYFESHRFHSSREFGKDPHHSFELERHVLNVFHAAQVIIHHH